MCSRERAKAECIVYSIDCLDRLRIRISANGETVATAVADAVDAVEAIVCRHAHVK